MGLNGNKVGVFTTRALFAAVVLFVAFGSSAPDLSADASGSAWPVSFEETAGEAGLAFRTAGEVHDPQGVDSDWPAFPEIAGAGACWADFTGDGYEDLYVTNQRFNEKNPYAEGFNELFDPTNRLYLNNGVGAFTDATQAAGVESRTFDYGCSGVDHDGDGFVDLLVYGFGHIKLYKNNGNGTFADVAQGVGLDVSTQCLPYECWTTCSAWADYDGDGWLDLFVCTFVDSDMEDDFRGPLQHTAQFNFLFKNNGNGTFTEVAEEAGVAGIAADERGSKSWGAVWFDANLNGLPDLYVANDMTPNEFYWNNGDGTFTRDDEAGLYDDRAGMGIATGDTTGDGYPDLYFTHYQYQYNGFYENRGDGTFLDRSGEDGLAGDWDYVGWGTHFVDLDRDGHLDVVVANGHTEWSVSNYGQETLVFQQEPQGDGTTQWVDRSAESGSGVLDEKVTRGAAVADHDLDGNVSVVLANNANETLQFLGGSGVTNHWIYVQPVQTGANHQAIGARVVVETGGVEQVREIQAGASFLSQNSLLADFGLGDAQGVDRVTIEWPHGGTTTVEDLPVNRVVRVDRETGNWSTDTLSPLTAITVAGEAGEGGWYGAGAEVSLAAEDRAIGEPSGVQITEYAHNDGVWTPYEGQAIEFPDEGADVTLSYRSRDADGNEEPVRKQGFQVDLTPPSTGITLNGTPGHGGWVLSDVDVGLSCTDALSGCNQTRYRLDGGAWQYGMDFTLDNDGSLLLGYQSQDGAGNWESEKHQTVKIDKTGPETTHVLDGEQGAEGWFRSDVDVTLTATDGSSGVNITEYRVDGGAWEQYTGPFVLEEENVFGLEYRSIDVAGNEEAPNTTTVKIDTSPPQTSFALEGEPGSGGWFVSNVTVTFNATDFASGVDLTEYRFDQGDWKTDSGPFLIAEDEVFSLEFTSVDVAGNQEPANVLEIGIDKDPPTTTASPSGTLLDNGWYEPPVDVTLSCVDVTSGCDTTEYRVDGGAWQPYETAFTVDEDGVHSVDYRSTDVAGHVEMVDSVEIKVGAGPPETIHSFEGELGDNDWYVTRVDVTLSCFDAASGCNTTEYRIDDGPWQDYGASFTVDEEGVRVLEYFSTNLAGHMEDLNSAGFKIDSEPPATEHSLNGTLGENGWYTSPVDVTLSCADATSGCAFTEYRVDDGAWLEYDGAVKVEGDGHWAVEYRSKDLAGNIEAGRSAALKIDTTPPEAEWLSPETNGVYVGPFGGHNPVGEKPVLAAPWARSGLLEESPLFQANAADGLSGVDRVEFRRQGEDDLLICEPVTQAPYACDWDPMMHAPVTAGEYDMELRVYDNAGNDVFVVLPVLILV